MSGHCEAEFHGLAITRLRLVSLAFAKQQCPEVIPRNRVVLFGSFAKPSLRFLYISGRTESVLTKKSHHALSVGIPFIRVRENIFARPCEVFAFEQCPRVIE